MNDVVIRGMTVFLGNSIFWFLGLILVIGLLYGLRAFLTWQTVKRDAVNEYELRAANSVLSIKREAYINAYKRTYAPRRMAYISGALLAVVIFTWPAMAIIQYALHGLWVLSDRSIDIEPGFLVWMFMIFFAILAVWASIVFVAARLYHRRAPLNFERELDRERRE